MSRKQKRAAKSEPQTEREPSSRSGSGGSGAAARSDSAAPSGEGRRNFIAQVGSVIIGAVLGLTPLVAGLVSFLNPLRGRRAKPTAYAGAGAGPEGHVRITTLAALTEGGPPQRFLVIDDLVDAWNYMPDQPVGAVYVQRTGPDEVLVFNTTCPHAGCSVSCDGAKFACPCHNSSFNLDGTKRSADSGRENPSPRGLDELETQVVDGEVWVRYQNFYTGKHERIPKA